MSAQVNNPYAQLDQQTTIQDEPSLIQLSSTQTTSLPSLSQFDSIPELNTFSSSLSSSVLPEPSVQLEVTSQLSSQVQVQDGKYNRNDRNENQLKHRNDDQQKLQHLLYQLADYDIYSFSLFLSCSSRY